MSHLIRVRNTCMFPSSLFTSIPYTPAGLRGSARLASTLRPSNPFKDSQAKFHAMMSAMLDIGRVKPLASTGASVEATSSCIQAGNEVLTDQDQEAKRQRLPGKKRLLALHVGYVGTEFTGFQAVRELAPEATVECLLELAMYKAGFIAETNYGHLFKVKWSRSSRTDKGVHALAMVVGVKLVLASDAIHETDPEGITIADAINRHLPAHVQVFSVQRVNQKFNARRACNDRVYEYYLPASVIGLDGSAEDAEKLRLFRAALVAYEGSHAFHNYTARKKLYLLEYTKEHRKAKKAKAAAVAATSVPPIHMEGEVSEMGKDIGAAERIVSIADGDAAIAECATLSEQVPTGDSSNQDVTAAGVSGTDTMVAGASGRHSRHRSRNTDDDDDDEAAAADDDEYEDGVDDTTEGTGMASAGSETSSSRWVQPCSWVAELTDPNDRVGVRHFRVVRRFTAQDPKPLVPGGIPCLRLEVAGQSFMLHQIRHMIGGAIVVARGLVSLDLLSASLAAPARVLMPRAPPHTLLLSGSIFSPFRKVGDAESAVSRFTGPCLMLREQGQARQQQFREQVLNPALNQLLAHPEWESFANNLVRYEWPQQLAEQVIAAHKEWKSAREAARKARQNEQKEAASQAVVKAPDIPPNTEGHEAHVQEEQ